MGHRQKRTTPTRPRRIHATDEEWTEIKGMAEKAGLSIAAYAVSRCLAASGPAIGREEFLRAQMLTSSYALLGEIADMMVPADNDVHAALVLKQLGDIAQILGLGGPCERATPSSEGER